MMSLCQKEEDLSRKIAGKKRLLGNGELNPGLRCDRAGY